MVTLGSPFLESFNNLHFYLNYISQIFNIYQVAVEQTNKSEVSFYLFLAI